jgi:uncharacterized protein (DUF58 family)
MNNKTLVLVFLIGGSILSALILRNGELLLVAMPFLVYLIVGIVQAPGDISLTANRIIDKAGVSAEEPFETRIVVRNQGSRLINLAFDDMLFPTMTILEGKANDRLSLPAGESAELNYVSKAGRGVYSWKTIHAYASDPFGLFEIERHIPAAGEIIVRPIPIHIHPPPLKPRSTLHAAGPIAARLAGSGTDFWGIREYRAGDSLRRLNWRLTARHPRKLFTNEYEREEIADFGIILDARRITSDDALEEALFEHAVSAAASLSENFLKKGNRVALLIFGESITTLFPGYGKKQLNSILRNLARARLGANVPLGHLEYFPVQLFPSQSQIVMISAVEARDLETYARLGAFGYDVLLISPDPVDYTARMLPMTEINALAVRAARVERVILLKRLLKMGIEVIDWQVTKSLDAILQDSARRILHRRNM